MRTRYGELDLRRCPDCATAELEGGVDEHAAPSSGVEAHACRIEEIHEFIALLEERMSPIDEAKRAADMYNICKPGGDDLARVGDRDRDGCRSALTVRIDSPLSLAYHTCPNRLAIFL